MKERKKEIEIEMGIQTGYNKLALRHEYGYKNS